MPATAACEICLRELSADQPTCPQHPHDPVLNLERATDRAWLEMRRSQRRRGRTDRVVIGLLLVEVLALGWTLNSGGLLAALHELPLLLIPLLTLAGYLIVQSFQEGRRVAEPDEDQLLPADPDHEDTSELSLELRTARRDRRTERSNVRDRLSRSSRVSAG